MVDALPAETLSILNIIHLREVIGFRAPRLTASNTHLDISMGFPATVPSHTHQSCLARCLRTICLALPCLPGPFTWQSTQQLESDMITTAKVEHNWPPRIVHLLTLRDGCVCG
ncbi:hypothetical protein BV22DRAFT_706555 [Leucogyrophana mollusca]|uniref:Uncharacterized protein n=1 Tax=Leucogyrophana mollusca TaxID=85980 RepID=A0ACB8B8M6_9AGAM|nr:hypothetical protein BV22DRAFT_706555 [Leucogyrophana mollusca]